MMIFIAAGLLFFFFFKSGYLKVDFSKFKNRDTDYLDLWEGKQYGELIKYGKSVLKKEPMDKTALVFTGFADFYEGISILNIEERTAYIDEAVSLLRKALFTDNQINSGIKYILGKAYYYKGHYYSNLTVKYLNEALSENYPGKDIYEYLGLAYSELGEYQESIANFEKALEIKSSDLLLLVLGQAYMNAGDTSKAEGYLLRAEEKTADKTLKEKSLFLLGGIYASRSDYAKAEKCYKKVLEINPGSADSYYHLGEIYEKQGDRVKARAEWRKAYRINPDHYGTRVKLFG